jgi:chromate transporter
MNDHPLLTLMIVIAPLSLAAIGGAASIYAPLQQQVVDTYHWLSGREFIELFAIARVTPGPGSMLTTLIGWNVAGLAGALVATLALFIPSSVLCFAVARNWGRYRGTAWHTALDNGLRPIGAGLLLAGALKILRLEDAGLLAWILAGGVAALLTWRPLLHPMYLLGAGAAIFVAVRAFAG